MRRSCIVLPHWGEFGFFILNHIRRVHRLGFSRKIVCCRRGEESYFPSATGFFYDWEDPIPDEAKAGMFSRLPGRRGPLSSLERRLGRRFPDSELVWTPGLKDPPPDARFKFDLSPRQRRGLSPDVVLGCRRRDFGPEKNFTGWEEIASALRAAGWSLGVVGRPETSYSPKACGVRSWDYGDGDADAALEMLGNCRLFIGTDSGVSHLAAFVSARMLVFYHRNPYNLVDRMRRANPRRVRVLDDAWRRPQRVVSEALRLLGARTRRDSSAAQA